MASLDDFLGGAKSKAGSLVDFMTGYTRSMVGQGAMLGTGDEAEAAMRAGLGFGGYDTNLETIRAENKQFQAEHPYIAMGTELAGAMLPAVLSRGRTAPASLARATAQNAVVGGLAGAGYGFGTGEGYEDRMSRAKGGALTGVGVGAIATPVGHALVGAGQRIVQPWMSRVRSIANPDQEAGRQIAGAIAADQRAGSRALTPQEDAIARQRTGQPIMNLDQGGEATRRLGRTAANKSPEAGALLQQRIGDRFEDQGPRIDAWLRRNTAATGDTGATRETLKTQARRANRPAYKKAYGDGDRDIWSPELERLSGSPDVLKAMHSAVKTGQSKAISDGFGGFNSPVTVENGILKIGKNNQGRQYPNLQYWDYVKREMDDAASAARNAGRKEEAARIGDQARMLRDELDKLVPSYSTARQGAASFFKADDALEAGETFVNINVNIGDARRALAKFNPAERQLFEDGFVSALMDKVSKVPDRADVVRRIWGNAKSREQITMVLGPQRAQEFEAFMNIETVMDASRGVLTNSTTARQFLDAVRQHGRGAPAGLLTLAGTGDPVAALVVGLMWRGGRSVIGGGMSRAMQDVDESVARRIATMLTSDDPNVYRQGLQAVARSQRLTGNLRSYIGMIGGVSGGQTGARPGGQ